MKPDELWPRVPEYRYRVYAVRSGGRTSRALEEMEVLAAAPDAGGLGQAILTLHEDEKAAGRKLSDRGRIGVLDVLAGPKGEWIVLPWDRHNS